MPFFHLFNNSGVTKPCGKNIVPKTISTPNTINCPSRRNFANQTGSTIAHYYFIDRRSPLSFLPIDIDAD
ncbi:hypothetical protein [Microcoleus sp. bin48.metabat.b7b8b9.023]|uniref:hypothetical protein n=1 Tax=unclassified Microcoleus TaxID=2642155 RepID=UPI003451A304